MSSARPADKRSAAFVVLSPMKPIILIALYLGVTLALGMLAVAGVSLAFGDGEVISALILAGSAAMLLVYSISQLPRAGH